MNHRDDIKSLRHSAAHLLAHAVQELYPETILTIGPATEDGFFYDFLPTKNFKEEDLPRITERMQEIVKRNLPLEHCQIPKEEARKIFANNRFKLELIDGIEGSTVGLATQGTFYDLCKGGHIASTGLLKNFKLLSISGAYWRADRDNQPLQRIYGTAFFTAEDLTAYEKTQEESMLYDHRRLGKTMDLFSFQDEGVGFPFFHPKGQRIINRLTTYMRTLLEKYEYEEVSTPTMLDESLWLRSGHDAHYRQNMYFSEVDGHSYALKPMNCPGAILIYKQKPRSYRELPLRLGEFGKVHRHELSGALHGLTRVRAFTQDDAHVFCTLEQLETEIHAMLEMGFTMLKKMGFEKYTLALSTRPSDSMGESSGWNEATNALKRALEKINKPYIIQEGDGAFYGPKIDLSIEDCMGRRWQTTTIQVDFVQPQNFDLNYVSSQGTKERPVIVHRALYGSLERFFAILLEHHKGDLPFWLCPLQARILTITDAQKDAAHKLRATLKAWGIHSEVDESSDPLAGQIKSAQLDRIPVMLILGKKEVENNTVTLRMLNGTQEQGLSLDTLHSRLTSFLNN